METRLTYLYNGHQGGHSRGSRKLLKTLELEVTAPYK